jgi:hypothetical protein
VTNLLLDHPNSVGETYFSHLGFAAETGFAMVGGGLACLAHAVLPFLFTRTASRCLEHLQARIGVRNAARGETASRSIPRDQPLPDGPRPPHPQ